MAIKYISILLFISLLFIGQASAGQYNYSKVILISWDGVEYDTLMNLYNNGSLPGMTEILSNGSLSRLMNDEFDTWTDPGHAQILSGRTIASMNMTGTSSWEIIPDGRTVFEGLKSNGEGL